MLNSDPAEAESADTQDASVQQILHSGAIGAIALAGVATLIVVAIWFAFYLLVFVSRAGAP
jgi:hypothetical protein